MGSSLDWLILDSSARVTPRATGMTARDHMIFSTSFKGRVVSLGSDFSKRSPNASLVHWNSCVDAASSLMSDPSLNVSHRLKKAFQVSSSTPISIVGLLSLGPLDAWTWGRECSRAWQLRRGPIISAGRSSVLYVQPDIGHATTTMMMICRGSVVATVYT